MLAAMRRASSCVGSFAAEHADCITPFFFRAPDKPFLDLRINLMKPLFRAFSSVLINPNFGLCYPIFGRAELVGKLLSHVERILAICLSHAGGFVKQPQNGLSRCIELISVIWTGVFRGRSKRDHLLRRRCGRNVGTRLSTHRILTQLASG